MTKPFCRCIICLNLKVQQHLICLGEMHSFRSRLNLSVIFVEEGDAYEFQNERRWSAIDEVRNSIGKRVCDISYDRKTVVIEIKGCVTRITANPDGTLKIENLPKAA